MFTFFSLPTHGPLSFTPGLPKDFNGPFLAGSQPYHFEGAFGTIVVQELVSDHFTLQLYFFHFVKKITLIRLLPQGLHSFFVHRGETGWKEQKRLRLREGQFLLCAGTNREWRVEPVREKPVELFQASFGRQLTGELTPAFPDLDELLQANAKPILSGPHTATGEIRDAVHQLLYAAYEPYRLSFYFKAKVSEYLFLLLHKAAYTVPEKDLVPAEWEKEAIFKIRDYILAGLLQHH